MEAQTLNATVDLLPRRKPSYRGLFLRSPGRRQGQSIEPWTTGLLLLPILASILLLTYSALLVRFSHSDFPTAMESSSHWPYLIDKPVGEDGYYMLTVAENIAHTGRILYNRAEVVTGIQPLSTYVFAGLALIVQSFHGNHLDLIRSTLLLGALLLVIFAAQVAVITSKLVPAAHRRKAWIIAFFLVLADFTLFRLFTYGLETGMYCNLLALCFESTLRIAQKGQASTREAMALGIVAGFAGLARIDFGLLFAVLLVGMFCFRWITLGRLMLAGLLASLIVSPWFLYLKHVSGSWMPSSGQAESGRLSADNVRERAWSMLSAVIGHLLPWDYGVRASTAVVVATLSVSVFLLLRRYSRQCPSSPLPSRIRSLFLLWGGAMTILVAIYFATFQASHFYYRYTAPLTLLSIPLLSVFTVPCIRSIKTLYVFALLLCCCFALWAATSLHSGKIGNSQTIVAGYVSRNFPRAHVGAFQSGVVGFCNPNVENLDGKLNAAALAATSNQQLPAYLENQGVRVIVDWPSVIRAALPTAYLNDAWEPCPVPLEGTESICLLHKNQDPSHARQALLLTH